MNIYKTTDYFNMTKEEAAQKVDDYNTREEAKVLDSGLEHVFFVTHEALEREFHSEKCQAYVKAKCYEILLLEFVSDNDNHNKYCMVFR